MPTRYSAIRGLGAFLRSYGRANVFLIPGPIIRVLSYVARSVNTGGGILEVLKIDASIAVAGLSYNFGLQGSAETTWQGLWFAC